MPDYTKEDYIEQHREDAERAGLEWFLPEPPEVEEITCISTKVKTKTATMGDC